MLSEWTLKLSNRVSSKIETFRVLKLSIRVENFRALKLSNRVSFRALKLSILATASV